MDSLTQITLGAAVGEVVLGRKLGNRAMMWGAIGGTIPDLDVISNLVMTELDALAVHRGITHSIFFSVAGGLACAWLVHRLYQTGTYRRRWYKACVTVTNLLLLLLMVFAVNQISGGWTGTIIAASIAVYLGWRLVSRYLNADLEQVDVSYRSWAWLFFLAFFTHLLLDCFTAFGTQVFLPFSNLRVAFNTIAVVDPGYTVPFVLLIILAATRRRSDPSRQLLTRLGIGLSSLYLLVTVINKERVDQVFSSALAHRGIAADRCRTSPTILNNLLWNCVAEDPDAYYVGLYSVR
ncbi:MAG: metal-dependent hydrolase, partial [Saprospiraceae bacterium]|nr:metal-dependent hydrolase [Saprospiraceae bacterium]